MGISEGNILTDENREHGRANEIVIFVTPQPWDHDPIGAYQVKLFGHMHGRAFSLSQRMVTGLKVRLFRRHQAVEGQ